jgi:hypothetical protein
VKGANEAAMQKMDIPDVERVRGAMTTFANIAYVIQALFLLYPAIVLYVMFLPHVRGACAGGPPPDCPLVDDDDDDDDDDEYDRGTPGSQGIQPPPTV